MQRNSQRKISSRPFIHVIFSRLNRRRRKKPFKFKLHISNHPFFTLVLSLAIVCPAQYAPLVCKYDLASVFFGSLTTTACVRSNWTVQWPKLILCISLTTKCAGAKKSIFGLLTSFSLLLTRNPNYSVWSVDSGSFFHVYSSEFRM